MKIRKIITYTEDIHSEGGRPVDPPARTAVVLAIIENPWAGQGYVADLLPGIDEVAPKLGELLAPRVVEALGAPVEAYGKAAIVGLDGEIEHGSGLIHTLKFGDHFRRRRRPPRCCPPWRSARPRAPVFDIPLKHITDATIRSHHQSIEVRVADGPRADEIVVGLAAAAQGRPQARLAPLATEQ